MWLIIPLLVLCLIIGYVAGKFVTDGENAERAAAYLRALDDRLTNEAEYNAVRNVIDHLYPGYIPSVSNGKHRPPGVATRDADEVKRIWP